MVLKEGKWYWMLTDGGVQWYGLYAGDASGSGFAGPWMQMHEVLLVTNEDKGVKTLQRVKKSGGTSGCTYVNMSKVVAIDCADDASQKRLDAYIKAQDSVIARTTPEQTKELLKGAPRVG